ncbi:STAS domain-containing protein [Magnetococcales bacterium HHB-1]
MMTTSYKNSAIEAVKEGTKLTISVIGAFSFEHHSAFRNAYRDQHDLTQIIISFAKVTSIDSSGVGMLLLLREFVQEHEHISDVTLSDIPPSIREILERMHILDLFIVE